MKPLCFYSFITAFCCFAAQGELLKVYIADYPPFQVLNTEKGPTGFSVELFNEIVKLSDLQIEYLEPPWARAQKMVTEEHNSIIFTLAKTPEREALYQWITSIYKVKEGVFSLASRQDIQIKNLNDVHNYSIALPHGDISVQTLQIYPEHIRGAFIVEDQEQCIRLLHLGRVDLNYNNDVGFFIAADVMGYRRELFKEVYITGQTEMGIAGNKNIDPTVVRKIQQGLITLKQNGVYDKLRLLWFGSAKQQ
jgi:polar amino acid transport system substrate-binding protein